MIKVKKIGIVILSILLLSFPVLAAERYEAAKGTESTTKHIVNSTKNTSQSVVQSVEPVAKVTDMPGRTKGAVLSLASLSIRNEGKGVIGVEGLTTCHIPVDQISVYIYLDRYDEESDSWYTVNSYPYNYYASDQPSGDYLATAITVFRVTDQEAGYFYRLRGFHMAWLDGMMYNFNTETDGIRITK